jgi:hypothetical protein
MSWVKSETRNTHEYWLSLDKKCEPGGVWQDAYAKWDGCVGYTRYFNAPREDGDPGDADSLHICSTADTIADLLDIHAAALAFFGEEWVGEQKRLEEVLAARGWVRK